MSYPYLSDFINELFGTQWTFPIATFGSFVALAILVASFIAKREIQRLEINRALPPMQLRNGTFQPAHFILNDLIVVTVLFGILGARVFHVLEYPSEFISDPASMLFSRGGFSIYGGLIVGVIAGSIVVRKRGLPIIGMLDALAPAIILAYGIGRLGCQISSDGDWGIMADMSIKPSWLPTWFWAQTYDNNILGINISSPGVYPTPLYESIAAFCIFVFIWLVRKKLAATGLIFSVYLLLSGFERLLIEKIRINSQYTLFGTTFTQAEFISTVLIIAGLAGILKVSRSTRRPKIVFSIFVLGLVTACTKL